MNMAKTLQIWVLLEEGQHGVGTQWTRNKKLVAKEQSNGVEQHYNTCVKTISSTLRWLKRSRTTQTTFDSVLTYFGP